ncbi:hypothetical protein Ciccas_013767 [Cichlidogyrus casuarinus]|uniref:Uncharacterized protein n=1 Tax=Cichlidogyrus casuarinus TaxID=1844966 RepID=A0ABD2PKA4_9PLAT
MTKTQTEDRAKEWLAEKAEVSRQETEREKIRERFTANVEKHRRESEKTILVLETELKQERRMRKNMEDFFDEMKQMLMQLMNKTKDKDEEISRLSSQTEEMKQMLVSFFSYTHFYPLQMQIMR